MVFQCFLGVDFFSWTSPGKTLVFSYLTQYFYSKGQKPANNKWVTSSFRSKSDEVYDLKETFLLCRLQLPWTHGFFVGMTGPWTPKKHIPSLNTGVETPQDFGSFSGRISGWVGLTSSNSRYFSSCNVLRDAMKRPSITSEKPVLKTRIAGIHWEGLHPKEYICVFLFKGVFHHLRK